jgi:hypothetical protein
MPPKSKYPFNKKVKLLFTIFTIFYFSPKVRLSPKSMLHWAEDPLAAQHLAAKSLSWSVPKPIWDNNQFPEVRKDGYDVSDIRHYSIWCTCRRPTYAPEQVV